jgi:hypothetical protein
VDCASTLKRGNDAIDAIRACIGAAAQESFHICEVCGQPGYLIGHNRTRCDEHFHTGSSPEWDERYRKTMTAAEWTSAVTARRRLELMPTELVTHTCGHDRTYTRPTADALKFVAEYARTTLCGLLEAGSGKRRTMTADKNPKDLEPADLERILAEWDSPESKLKFEQSHRFLRRVIYAGLKDLNTGFDSPLACHFSPEDFLIVIDRCESLGVEVIGVEVFTTDVEPPYKAGLEDIEISPVPGYDWARRLVSKYMETPAITICATFDVPDALLKSNPKQAGESNQ